MPPFWSSPSSVFASAHANQDGATDGFILFSTDRDSADSDNPISEEIYVMLPDGTQPTRITDNAVNDKAPVWSHSKKIIAFHSGQNGRPEIFLMNLDGTERRLLASLGQAGAQFPSFSHNGNELCFNSQTTPREIYVVDVHGTGLTNLTNHPGDDLRCDWSPKGKIVFTSNRARQPGALRHERRRIRSCPADQTAHALIQMLTGRRKGTASHSRATATVTPRSTS